MGRSFLPVRRRGGSRGSVIGTESRWGLLAVLLGAAGVVVGAAAHVVSKDDGLRLVWIGLLIAGAVFAAPALVLQSPWWRERWRTGRERSERHRADERHFETSARGVLRPDWPGSYFTGRTRALRALVDFLDAAPTDARRGAGVRDRVRVVVGQPGCGKSAVLGRLMILADPVRRREDKNLGPVVPLVGVIDGAIHARGKDASHILGALAECADMAGVLSIPARPSGALVDELLLALQSRCPLVTVVIDALDEAVEPEQVIREVIQPLVDSGPEVGIRLVLGLRRQLLHLLDVPAHAVVDLDDANYFDRTDLVEYALRCLTLGIDPMVDSPYRADVSYASKVAAAIADRAGQVFLIAQLTARALAHDAAVVDLVSPAGASFPSRVGTAMDALLARFADAARVRDLLVPLAFAEGSGLPPGPLWAGLASALGTSAHAEQDVRWLLSSTPAVDLLQRVDLGDKDSRYRLFHEALAEHLRERTAHVAPHDAITRALLQGVVRTSAGERDWQAAHPYVRAYLATHAARSGHLDELLSDPNFLLAAEPDPLLRVLPSVRDQGARRTAAIYRGVVHQLRTCTAGEGAALLELHARQEGHHGLAERVGGTNCGRPWSTPWVRARPVHPHQVVGRHDGDVNTVAVAKVDGRLCVISGDAAGEVGMWDLEHGTRLGEPITAPAGEVQAITVGQASRGGTVVVLGGDQGLWVANADGSGLRQVGSQTGVRCVAVTEASGALVLVAGDVDGRIGMYDLTNGACRNAPFDAHADGVQVLAPAELHGRSVVASGGTDGSVAVWDLVGCHVVSSLPAAATEAVATIAWSAASGGPATLTVGGLDGIVRVWDVATGQTLATRVLGYDGWLNCLTLAAFSGRPAVVGGAIDGRALIWRGVTDALADTAESAVTADAALAGHDGWISGIAAVEYNDRDLIVTGGLDGTVRTWDLADADLLADRGDAHDGEVTTVSLLALSEEPQSEEPQSEEPQSEERRVAVSGSTDGTIRLWRLADGGLLADPIPAHDQGVRVVATAGLGGRATIASGGNDGSVRVWDGVTGQPIGDPVAAHTRTVRALILLSIDNRPMLITGGDGGVRRWDPVSGTPIGEALAGDQEIRAVAVTLADGRPILVAGGDGGVYRWYLPTGEPIGPILAPGERINAVAVGRVNGTPAVVAGTEKAGVQCWGLATGAAVGSWRAEHPIRSLAVSETGDHPVAVAGDDRGLTVYPLRGQRRAQRIRLGFRASAIAAVSSSDLLIGSWRGLYSLHVTDGT